MPDKLGAKSPRSSARKEQRSPHSLKNSEQKFYELIESMPMVAVQGYDKQRRVIYWNDASRLIYGYTREEAEGRLLEDLIIPDHMREGVIDAHQNWLDNNVSIPAQELDLQHKDGHLVPVFSSHVMIKQDTGECEMFCIDISLQEQKKAKEKLHWMANFDDLTELPNRRLMELELEVRIEEAKRRPNSEVAVVFIDLDNFKIINDTLGHHYGDELICAVAESLKAETRSSDLISRFGGDEFVLLLVDYHGIEGIAELCHRLNKALDRGFKIDGLLYQVTASFGISLFPNDGETVSELLGNADAAMYQAKDKGKNSVCFYTSDINDRLHHYQKIAMTLHNALSDDTLQLYFQPQIDLNDGHILSCEALLRCSDNNSQPIPPDVFIPVAEKSGLINRIGNWVIEAACQQLVAWKGTALENVRIDINLSGKQLTNPNLAEQILKTLHQHELRPSQLGVELTENEVIGGDNVQIGQLETLKNAGVHISIDDFGTGYSSLVYLSKLPVCSLKIDRSFLVHAMENESDMAIMKAIINVGHSLGLTVVVEGVETIEQDKLVKSLGCDLAQGYLYARPMPADKMPEYLYDILPKP
ncbi:GGDEF domain-containing protein [Aliidiomarina shirensis]|uniref:GGDEF domain-containing protein n=1 Tax=Aliidiomarina shirensis TaxID=1048642 RepID=A0A432WSI7_9GAMM|nr:GGDEF domain-containing phosphodiesterase [Aliidiomarina shirensis]RUO36733.1 GGDEF domain-containing protein [Aliidiomarina shirensis]